MKAILNKHINLATVAEDDLALSVSSGSSLIIQVSNIDGSLVVEGRNIEAEEYTALYAVSNSFAIVSGISNEGIYTFDISGVDRIKLNHNGSTGEISIKVVD